jgi:hypothetical protein
MGLKEVIYFILSYYLCCWASALWLKNILESHDGYYFIRNRQSFYGEFHLEVLLNPFLVNVFAINLGKYWNLRLSIYQSFLEAAKQKLPLDTKTILMIKEEFGSLYDKQIHQMNQYR